MVVDRYLAIPPPQRDPRTSSERQHMRETTPLQTWREPQKNWRFMR
jgi:hypothetical protein